MGHQVPPQRLPKSSTSDSLASVTRTRAVAGGQISTFQSDGHRAHGVPHSIAPGGHRRGLSTSAAVGASKLVDTTPSRRPPAAGAVAVAGVPSSHRRTQSHAAALPSVEARGRVAGDTMRSVQASSAARASQIPATRQAAPASSARVRTLSTPSTVDKSQPSRANTSPDKILRLAAERARATTPRRPGGGVGGGLPQPPPNDELKLPGLPRSALPRTTSTTTTTTMTRALASTTRPLNRDPITTGSSEGLIGKSSSTSHLSKLSLPVPSRSGPTNSSGASVASKTSTGLPPSSTTSRLAPATKISTGATPSRTPFKKPSLPAPRVTNASGTQDKIADLRARLAALDRPSVR